MSLRPTLPRSLVKQAHGSLNPPDMPWEDTGGGTNAAVVLASKVSAASGNWYDVLYQPKVTVVTGVSSLAARVGSGAAFTQATGSKQPAWNAATGMHFVAASSQLLAGPNLGTLIGATQWTMMAVVNMDNVAAGSGPTAWYANQYIVGDNPSAAGLTVGGTGGGGKALAGVYNGTSYNAAQGTIAAGAYTLIQGSWNNSDSTCRVRVDGAAEATTVFSGNLAALSTCYMGARSVANFCDAYMKGVLFFPTQLSGSTLSSMRAAVGAYYGVTV